MPLSFVPQDDLIHATRITLPRMATVVVATVVLYVAQEVFLPIALAMLIAFAMSPLVVSARRMGMGHLGSVLGASALAFSGIGVFCLIVFGQLAELALNLPAFQSNIMAKLNDLQAASGESGVVSRLMRMASAISSKIGAAVPDSDAVRPLAVEVVNPVNPLAFLQNLIVPLISPIATLGLVVVLVIFMLLERGQLRDRFIRLVGAADLHRTTQVLEDAGQRVAKYLLTQLLVNAIYALPIGIGLWLIGVPNATLWGLLTLVLRFVPYIGSVLAAAFPLFLAFAVSPDWTAVLLTAALFLIVEAITSNVIEPRLYSSNTGVSSLAIIIAAIFWTFLWGPLGLMLSTPLTVCLVVLGRHIPQFELFDILFGDQPVLAGHQRLYQRLLAGDTVEAISSAEEALEYQSIDEFHQDVVLPALLIAQDDRDRGVLSAAQEGRVASTGLAMVSSIAGLAAEMAPLPATADGPEEEPAADGTDALRNRTVTCVGGRWDIDEVSAAILAQSLTLEGASAVSRPAAELLPGRIASLVPEAGDCLILCFLDPKPSRASLLHVRRLKRIMPGLRVGVAIWAMPSDLAHTSDGALSTASVDPAKIDEARDLGADFVVTTLAEAVEAGLDDVPGAALPEEAPARPSQRRRMRPKSA
ncbi:MAG: AI-2E family transporter [Rhodobacterales bacterium]|nr:AI-2E family transporter [Rhodobacterales bacterium]